MPIRLASSACFSPAIPRRSRMRLPVRPFLIITDLPCPIHNLLRFRDLFMTKRHKFTKTQLGCVFIYKIVVNFKGVIAQFSKTTRY
jgi:hypothetical protein